MTLGGFALIIVNLTIVPSQQAGQSQTSKKCLQGLEHTNLLDLV
jgi:hypothetical protein